MRTRILYPAYYPDSLRHHVYGLQTTYASPGDVGLAGSTIQVVWQGCELLECISQSRRAILFHVFPELLKYFCCIFSKSRHGLWITVSLLSLNEACRWRFLGDTAHTSNGVTLAIRNFSGGARPIRSIRWIPLGGDELNDTGCGFDNRSQTSSSEDP